MRKNKSLSESIEFLEYVLAKRIFILSHFPDAKIQESNYTTKYLSKTVNNTYTKLSFETRYNTLYVIPYFELSFTYKDKTEIIKIQSSPQRTRLAYVSYPSFLQMRAMKLQGQMPERMLKFARLAINVKSHNFNETLIKECYGEIMKFIQANPSVKLDTKHLDPRLKKLLSFI